MCFLSFLLIKISKSELKEICYKVTNNNLNEKKDHNELNDRNNSSAT